MTFQTCMTHFHLWIVKEGILKYVGQLVNIFHLFDFILTQKHNGSQWEPKLFGFFCCGGGGGGGTIAIS